MRSQIQICRHERISYIFPFSFGFFQIFSPHVFSFSLSLTFCSTFCVARTQLISVIFQNCWCYTHARNNTPYTLPRFRKINRMHYVFFFFFRLNWILWKQFIGTQGVAFVVGVAGSAVLLDYSTLNSSIQPLIRDSMRRLIMSSMRPDAGTVLNMIQENVSRKEKPKSFCCANNRKTNIFTQTYTHTRINCYICIRVDQFEKYMT